MCFSFLLFLCSNGICMKEIVGWYRSNRSSKELLTRAQSGIRLWIDHLRHKYYEYTFTKSLSIGHWLALLWWETFSSPHTFLESPNGKTNGCGSTTVAISSSCARHSCFFIRKEPQKPNIRLLFLIYVACRQTNTYEFIYIEVLLPKTISIVYLPTVWPCNV